MAEDQKPRLLTVVATDPKKVGVWDRGPDHPHKDDEEFGEVFVSGTQPVEVAGTPVVLDALAKGRIREVAGHSVPQRQPSEGPIASTTPQGRK